MLLYYLFVKLDREYSYSFSDIAAKFIDSLHEDYLQLSFLQVRILFLIKKFTSVSALKTIFQRVQTVISISVSTFLFLKQTKQPVLRTADVYNLVNSIKNEDYANVDSESRFFTKKLQILQILLQF